MASKIFSRSSPARSLSGCEAPRQNGDFAEEAPRDTGVRRPRGFGSDFSTAITRRNYFKRGSIQQQPGSAQKGDQS
jgi:hypothetical protein